MTIPEAVQLVLQASALGVNGELFVLDMGAPVKIADLARDMIELSGLKVGEDIRIEYTGLRPGERLSETLFAANEHPQRTQHEMIFVNHNHCQPGGEQFNQQVEALIQFALDEQETPARALLQQLACGPQKNTRPSRSIPLGDGKARNLTEKHAAIAERSGAARSLPFRVSPWGTERHGATEIHGKHGRFQ